MARGLQKKFRRTIAGDCPRLLEAAKAIAEATLKISSIDRE
jgi:hypothetical protein